MKTTFFLSALTWSLLTVSLTAQTFTDIPGPMGTVRSILKGTNGEWYVGSNSKGVFHSQNGGQSWSGLGGNTIMTGRINAMIYDSSGQIVVATEQGGTKTWNGTAWVNINTGLFTACSTTIPIRDLVKAPDGHLYAAAHAYSICFPQGDLYRYDGVAWTSIAAGLGNTNVNTLTIHPLTGHLFAGTDGGVFQYDGNTWTAVNTGLNDMIVHKLVFSSQGDLFAGTDAGLSKWSASGTAWAPLYSGPGVEPVFTMAIDPLDDHLLIGTGYSVEQAGSLYGHMLESLDGGSSWTAVDTGIESTVINSIAFMDDHNCLAAGWGIFHSSNNGHSWATANSGFSAKTFTTQGRLAVSPSPQYALFYGTDDGVFRSTDEGLTWTMASRGLTRHIVTLLKADHAGNLFCSVMRYLGENSVGFGDGVLYKSSDNGDHWQPVTISKDWRYMEMSELANGDLICSHGFGAQPPSATIVGSGLARSTDHGDTWVDLDVSVGLGYCCAANAAGDLFVAGESQSVYRSTDGGNTFELVVAPGQSGNVGNLEVSPTGDIIMGSGGQRTLFFSTDNGSTYQTFNSPVLPDYRGASDVTFDHLGKAYCTTSGQGGAPSLFTIEPPFTPDATLTPVAGLAGSLFKMTWDECGYLYIYRGGGILKSSEPLRLPEADCVTGVETLAASDPGIRVFPNPVSNTLQIYAEHSDVVRMELWNLCGQKVKESVVSGTASWDIEQLANGVYLLKSWQKDGKPRCVKVVVAK